MKNTSSSLLAMPLIAITAFSQGDHALLQQVLLRQSTAAYQAVQDKNLAALQAAVTPDVLEVASGGILGPGTFSSMLQQCTLTRYHLSQPGVRVLNATAAVLAYKVNQVSTCGKKPEPQVTYDTDVFVNRNGKWLIATHTETGAQ